MSLLGHGLFAASQARGSLLARRALDPRDCQRATLRASFDARDTQFGRSRSRDVREGKAILLGSTPELEQPESGVLVGDNTGIMARYIPRWIRHKHLPSPKVRVLANWDRKIEALALEAVDRDVRLVAGTPAWFAGLFHEVLRVAARRGRKSDTILDVWPRLRMLTGGGVRAARRARQHHA